jgi:hypothetical protein
VSVASKKTFLDLLTRVSRSEKVSLQSIKSLIHKGLFQFGFFAPVDGLDTHLWVRAGWEGDPRRFTGDQDRGNRVSL